MAIYGVLGDIHGNLEALVVALDALRDRGVERLLCIGDVIGYNADSNECVTVMRRQDARIIAGNHDLIGTGQLGFDRCSNKARFSLQRTRKTLIPDNAAWLRALPGTLLVDSEIALVHGGVRDVQLYMTKSSHIRSNAALLRQDFPSARICFFGHCHQQRIYEVVAEEVTELADHPGVLARNRTYFVNPGSIDAQRKSGQRMAEFAIFDTARWAIEFYRLPYDSALTEAKAASQGYRIGPHVDRWYTLRRRVTSRLRRLAVANRGEHR